MHNKPLKTIFLTAVLTITAIITPFLAFAHSDDLKTYRAEVIEVIEEKTQIRENGGEANLQVLKLRIKDGEIKGEEVVYDGGKYDVLSAPKYAKGDNVIVNSTINADRETIYYVTDYDRSSILIWLALFFALSVVLIGKIKGLRALVVLVLTFFIVLKFIIPYILTGHNPLLISIVGALIILIIAIYLTEGFSRESHIAVSAIFFSLIITGLLSLIFIVATKLTGFADEDTMFLASSAVGGIINFQGLLLAGIIIGALGVLDDVVISQIMVVKELVKADKKLTSYELYKKAMRVGVSHLASMVNTLFLAYAGASLPLLILLTNAQNNLTLMQSLSNEALATEIVRTLAGSIGLVLAIPIATILAVKFRGK